MPKLSPWLETWDEKSSHYSNKWLSKVTSDVIMLCYLVSDEKSSADVKHKWLLVVQSGYPGLFNGSLVACMSFVSCQQWCVARKLEALTKHDPAPVNHVWHCARQCTMGETYTCHYQLNSQVMSRVFNVDKSFSHQRRVIRRYNSLQYDMLLDTSLQ